MIAIVVGGVIFLAFLVILAMAAWYKKVPQGKAMVKTGAGGTNVSFEGMFVLPVFHRLEIMDISVKNIEIARTGKDGLICMDNLRADIKVVFFVRINKSKEAVIEVAQSIGCERASHESTLVTLFDAKFSEALKTVGKQFNFVDLYNAREKFKEQIIETIGRDLNGYILDDCAIDYLEQTPLEFLKDDNILDSEGIKKITELTAEQHILANKIRRTEEKTITQQNVEAQEAILELNRQLAEKEEKQKREIASIKAREEAETAKIQSEEKLRSEKARIITEEEVAIAEENKKRQIIVAAKNKERTEAVETERVLKDKELEVNEREKVVSLAQIDKEKSVEEQKKNIQDVIRERVIVEKAVVEEEEKIKDTRAFAEANRNKSVALTDAEKIAQEELIKKVQMAEAQMQASQIIAKQKMIDAEADQKAAELKAQATKTLADASAAEKAAPGLAEAKVMEAKAFAKQKEGESEANVMQLKAVAVQKEGEADAAVKSALAEAQKKEAEAEAFGIDIKADADEKAGVKQAHVLQEKMLAEAKGIEAKGLADAKSVEAKAQAMQKLDGVGKDHEEFKLKLERETQIELARINIQTAIAEAQAKVLAEALKSAKIDIVGGESTFFDKIVGAVTQGKTIDSLVGSSNVLTDIKENLLDTEGGGNLVDKVKSIIGSLGLTSEDVKNLSVASLIMKLSSNTSDTGLQKTLTELLNKVWSAGVANLPAAKVLGL
ncbi:MAG: flotillin family protein [Bacteroidia bacterium]|nr:flotillin family protein [Bacteroidia bacterium]